MKILVLLAVLLLVASCEDPKPAKPTPTPTPTPTEKPSDNDSNYDKEDAVQLWATLYYSKEVKASSTGVPLRDMSGKVIGPKLNNKTWCLAAIEGTVRVSGVTYNYAGKTGSSQADCGSSWRSSEKVRWSISQFQFGKGNKDNPLVPFYSVACDQTKFKFGQRFFIPEAKGVKLPDGSTHTGIFSCDDVGGAIKGNHIDVFIGTVVGGLSGALQVNPFTFVKSTSSGLFKAYLL